MAKAYNSDFQLLRFIHWLISFSKRIFVNNRQNFPAIEWEKQIPGLAQRLLLPLYHLIELANDVHRFVGQFPRKQQFTGTV